MSSQDSNKDQITLELSPKDTNSKLNELQVQQYPPLSLNAQSTILSNLSEDIIDTIPLSSQKQKILQKYDGKFNTNKSIQYCKSHNKPLQVICIEDGCKICTNCAIFGQHKGHHFKSEEDFKRDIGKYLEDINKIVDKKINLQSDNIKQRLKKVSSTKKTQLINIIEKKVNNLRLIIDKLEIQSKKLVTNIVFDIQDTAEKAIKKVSDKLSLQYNDWEAQSSKYIETLGSNQLKEQINIIYSQNQQSHTIKGDKIFQKYNTKASQLFQEYKEQINLVRADINSEIDSILTKAIHVTNKIQLPLLPLPVLSHYISNGQQKLLVEEPQKHEMILNIQSPKESESAISYQNKSDRFNNTSFSSLNIPKLSQSFIVGQKNIHDFSFRSDNKKKTAPNTKRLIDTAILKPSIPIKSKSQKGIKLDPKVQKTFDSLIADKIQLLDLTNAELGDSTIEHITKHLIDSKCTAVKLIRNKITDQGLIKIFKYFQNVISLNLSQNLLTDNSIHYILQNIQRLPKLKNLGLSLNKIKQRNVRNKIQEIKKKGIIVSI